MATPELDKTLQLISSLTQTVGARSLAEMVIENQQIMHRLAMIGLEQLLGDQPNDSKSTSPVVPENERMIPHSDAAEMIGVSTETVRNWFNTGRIEGEKISSRKILLPISEVKRMAEIHKDKL